MIFVRLDQANQVFEFFPAARFVRKKAENLIYLGINAKNKL